MLQIAATLDPAICKTALQEAAGVFPRLPADRKPGVDGIESPDYDQSHLIFHH